MTPPPVAPVDYSGPCWRCRMNVPCVHVENIGRVCSPCYESITIDLEPLTLDATTPLDTKRARDAVPSA